jgi:hypothetical protein
MPPHPSSPPGPLPHYLLSPHHLPLRMSSAPLSHFAFPTSHCHRVRAPCSAVHCARPARAVQLATRRDSDDSDDQAGLGTCSATCFRSSPSTRARVCSASRSRTASPHRRRASSSCSAPRVAAARRVTHAGWSWGWGWEMGLGMEGVGRGARGGAGMEMGVGCVGSLAARGCGVGCGPVPRARPRGEVRRRAARGGPLAPAPAL